MMRCFAFLFVGFIVIMRRYDYCASSVMITSETLSKLSDRCDVPLRSP
jgi:hypothetical protein